MISAPKFRSAFFVLLIAGPLLVVPFLMLMPTIAVARAGYKTSLLLRLAVVGSVSSAFLLTCPPSPFFFGLDGPIPLFAVRSFLVGYPDLAELAVSQCYLMNASIVAACVMLPVNAIYTGTRLRNVSSQQSVESTNNNGVLR